MHTVDLREHIHREIARAGPLDAFMLGLVSAMQTDVAPEWDWGPFRELVLDDTEALRADGLLPAFAAAKRTTDARVLRVDFEAMDLYFALTPTLEPPGVTARRARLARSRAVARIVSACRMPHDTSPDDGRPPVMAVWPLLTGYAAKATALLLETTAKDLPLEHELEVAVSRLGLGRVDRTGFVPTPAAVAAEGIRRAHARDGRWLAERQGPSLGEYAPYGGPTLAAYHRRFRAEDGRTWEVRVEGGALHLAFTDTDGDAHATKRPSTDPLWDAERLVAEQRREGFVELHV